MYKAASQRTGGSLRNGFARPTRGRGYERASHDAPLARCILQLTYQRGAAAFVKISDRDVALLVVKLVNGEYTRNQALVRASGTLSFRLNVGRGDLVLSELERERLVSLLLDLAKRWRNVS